MSSTQFDTGKLLEYLRYYYVNIFPSKALFEWLSYGRKSEEYLNRRELAFILEDDIHVRYQSFDNVADFERDLCSRVPHKLDIGAVYNKQPRKYGRALDFVPLERELVFDIDLTDYDDVRTCCKDARVCDKCWKFVALAARVLDGLLESHFGFQSRLWLFSGRRGVHCWVADQSARLLNNAGRSAVAEYLNLINTKHSKRDADRQQQQQQGYPSGRSSAKPVHPVFSNAFDLLFKDDLFRDLVVEQGWLDDGCWQTVVGKYFSNDATLKQEFEELPSGGDRFDALRARIDPQRMEMLAKKIDPRDVSISVRLAATRNWVLQQAYPRLDVHVSTGTNHLLKSPFCVHPKTGCLAVPILPAEAHLFRPDQAPRVDKLIGEFRTAALSQLSQLQEQAGEEGAKENCHQSYRGRGYELTSLQKYVALFEKFVTGIKNSDRNTSASSTA